MHFSAQTPMQRPTCSSDTGKGLDSTCQEQQATMKLLDLYMQQGSC